MYRIKKTKDGYEVYDTINRKLATLESKRSAIMYTYGADAIQVFIMPARNEWLLINKRNRECPDWKIINKYESESEAQKALKEWFAKQEVKSKQKKTKKKSKK